MKRLMNTLLLALGLAAFAFATPACQEGELTKGAARVEEGAERAGEKLDEAGEKIEEGAEELGDDMERAWEDRPRINVEVE